MKIRTITAYAVSLPMKKPVKMSGVEIRNADNTVVRIETDTGVVGWGEAGSAPNMTGETVESMCAAVRYMTPFLIDRAADDFHGLHAEMDWRMVGNHAAKATIDVALHDAVARARNVPVHRLLADQRRDKVPLLWLVGTGTPEGDLKESAKLKADGFVAYKIKVGADSVAQDASRTRAICEVLGRGMLISADVNQAWTVDKATEYLRLIGDAPLDFLEQPIMGDDVAGMARIAAQSRVAIGADEGLHGIADIRRHHDAHAARGGSLKTIKFGGIGPAYAGGCLAHDLGMNVNLACKMAESSIGAATILQLAAVLPNMNWGVSLSSLYLADDLVAQPIGMARGHASVPVGPGLGVEVDPEKVKAYARPV